MEILMWLALLGRMSDVKLTVAQRNDACFALRGNAAEFIVSAMRRELADPAVRACAGMNLRKAGAIDQLKSALSDDDFEVRALAARELGGFEKPGILPLLARAARDPQLVVASNAIEAMAHYRDPLVVPYLLAIAERGGLIGVAALDNAVPFGGPEVLRAARAMLEHADVSEKLCAMRALARLGNATDIAALREIETKETATVSSRSRGFGLMPAISLSRAALTAIQQIEARGSTAARF